MTIAQTIKKLATALEHLKFNRHTVVDKEKSPDKRQALTAAEDAITSLKSVSKKLTNEQKKIYLRACDKLGTYYQFGLADHAKARPYYEQFLATANDQTQFLLDIKIKDFYAKVYIEKNDNTTILLKSAKDWLRKLAKEHKEIFQLLDSHQELTDDQVRVILNFCFLQLRLAELVAGSDERIKLLIKTINYIKQLPLNRIATRTDLAYALTSLGICYQEKNDLNKALATFIEANQHWLIHNKMTKHSHPNSFTIMLYHAEVLYNLRKYTHCISLLKNTIALEANVRLNIPDTIISRMILVLASAYASNKDPLLALHHLEKLIARRDLAYNAAQAKKQIERLIKINLRYCKTTSMFNEHNAHKFQANYAEVMTSIKFLQLCLSYCDKEQKDTYKSILEQVQAFHAYQTKVIQQRLSGIEEDTRANPAEHIEEKAEVATVASITVNPVLIKTGKKRSSLHFFAKDDLRLLRDIEIDDDLTLNSRLDEKARDQMRNTKRVRR